jgi:hypothetical protein
MYAAPRISFSKAPGLPVRATRMRISSAGLPLCQSQEVFVSSPTSGVKVLLDQHIDKELSRIRVQVSDDAIILLSQSFFAPFRYSDTAPRMEWLGLIFVMLLRSVQERRLQMLLVDIKGHLVDVLLIQTQQIG